MNCSKKADAPALSQPWLTLFPETYNVYKGAYSLLTGGLIEAASGGVGVGAGASVLGCAFGSRRSWTHSSNLLIPSALEMTALAPTAVASDNPNNSLYIV